MSSVKKDKEKNASKDMPDFVHLKKQLWKTHSRKVLCKSEKKNLC